MGARSVIQLREATRIFQSNLEARMATDKVPHVFELAGGDICVWVDPGGAICLKTRDQFNDPIELAEHEALALADLLRRLVEQQVS